MFILGNLLVGLLLTNIVIGSGLAVLSLAFFEDHYVTFAQWRIKRRA